MPVDEGLKFGGIRYHGEEFLGRKVELMCNPRDHKARQGLGLGHVKSWADIKRVRECHQGYCWIDQRIEDYRGARGPVWRRIAASDGLWIIFMRAEERHGGPLNPSFLMVKAIIDNHEREIDVGMVVAGIALAIEVGGDVRDAEQDYRIIHVVCEVAEQDRKHGIPSTADDVIKNAKTMLQTPQFERCWQEPVVKG